MTIVCLIISFHSMLVTNGAYSKIELSVVELPCNYVSKAKIDRYTVYDYYSLRIWLLCKSLDDKDQIDGIWYDSTFFFFLVLYFSMLRYFPACQWPGRHHQRLPVQVAQGQEVEEVLVRDEGQGPLHIQGFRGKEGGLTTVLLDSYTIRLIYCMHIIQGIWIFFYENICMFMIIVFYNSYRWDKEKPWLRYVVKANVVLMVLDATF